MPTRQWYLEYKLNDDQGIERTFRVPLVLPPRSDPDITSDNTYLGDAFTAALESAALAWPIIQSTATALQAGQRLNLHYEVVCAQRIHGNVA